METITEKLTHLNAFIRQCVASEYAAHGESDAEFGRTEWLPGSYTGEPDPSAASVLRCVESAGGAPALGSGGNCVAFAPGPSPAATPVLPPGALRAGHAVFPLPALQVDHEARTRNADPAASGFPSRREWNMPCSHPAIRNTRWQACLRPGNPVSQHRTEGERPTTPSLSQQSGCKSQTTHRCRGD